MTELEKLCCTDSKVEAVKKINAIIDNRELDGKITNCLLEVPQRIKLELNDGVLTLKAGSEVIVPNGFKADGVTPKFDYVTIESDITYTDSGLANTSLVFYNLKNNTIFRRGTTPQSGTSVPDGLNTVYYNTATNTCHNYSNGTQGVQASFPIGICTSNAEATNNIVSIDQTFNGFGYIGSTIWVDKGVKGLIPDGRNEDGSLKNVEFVTQRVLTNTNSNTNDYVIALNSTTFVDTRIQAYDEEKNIVYNTSTGAKTSFCLVGTMARNTGIVYNFNPKQPFRAIDYSDKSEISGWGMPSNKYIDLSLGASGTYYTAPANGYFTIDKQTSGTNQYIQFINTSVQLATSIQAPGTYNIRAFVPVKKGQQLKVNYTAGGEVVWFRFIYAEGEV